MQLQSLKPSVTLIQIISSLKDVFIFIAISFHIFWEPLQCRDMFFPLGFEINTIFYNVTPHLLLNSRHIQKLKWPRMYFTPIWLNDLHGVFVWQSVWSTRLGSTNQNDRRGTAQTMVMTVGAWGCQWSASWRWHGNQMYCCAAWCDFYLSWHVS